MNKFKITTLLLFVSATLFAQSGILKGNVKEKITNEGAIGATVKIANTTFAAMTDIEGNFIFSKLSAGNYKIVITSIGFAPKEIDNVRIESDKTTLINAILEDDSKMLEGVVVKAQRMTGTEVSVISEIKQIQNIAVG